MRYVSSRYRAHLICFERNDSRRMPVQGEEFHLECLTIRINMNNGAHIARL